MDKFGCVLEMMFGNILFGEQLGGHIVQKEQLEQLVKLGLECYVGRRNQEAIKYFKQAIKVCPRADVYNYLGLVHLNDGDYARAFNAFQSALTVDNTYLPAFYNLGVACHYGKKYDVAADIFADILKSSEGLEKDILLCTYNDLACALNRMGKSEEAIMNFQSALKLDDKFVRPYTNIGNIYVNQGKFAEAKVQYETAVKLDDKCAAAYNGLGVLEVENGNFAEAGKLFDKAIESDKACQAAHVNKMILERLQKEKTAQN